MKSTSLNGQQQQGGSRSALAHGKTCVRPKFFWLKGQHNVFFGYTCLNQFIGNRSVGTVVFNPDLVIFHVNMQDGSMNACVLEPACAKDSKAGVVFIN